MTECQLIIKQRYFDQIISGEKKLETREIRPNTANKYCEFDADGNLTGARKYDALRLFNGCETNRPTALVEVESAEIVLLEDENGELITYTENNQEYVAAQVDFYLGKIIETHNV